MKRHFASARNGWPPPDIIKTKILLWNYTGDVGVVVGFRVGGRKHQNRQKVVMKSEILA